MALCSLNEYRSKRIIKVSSGPGSSEHKNKDFLFLLSYFLGFHSTSQKVNCKYLHTTFTTHLTLER
jgi:hypothetical protein